MKTAALKYLAVIFILLLMLERSTVPVVKLFVKQSGVTANDLCSDCSEEPAKTSENVNEFGVKDYLHIFQTFTFCQPVYLLPLKQIALFKAKFPDNFYPDVLTPPPNHC